MWSATLATALAELAAPKFVGPWTLTRVLLGCPVEILTLGSGSLPRPSRSAGRPSRSHPGHPDRLVTVAPRPQGHIRRDSRTCPATTRALPFRSRRADSC